MESTHNITPTRSSPRKKNTSPPHAAAAASLSPSKRQKKSPGNLSFKESSPSPRQRRQSLRRSVGKKHRRTLPPIYHNATALSEAISLELPESDRLSELLQSCFEFSIRNLENALSHSDGFSAELFNNSVMSVKEKFTRFIERLSRDGTFQRCTEKLNSFMADEEFEVAETEIKNNISKFSTESSRWEELLEDYKEKTVVLCRRLEECKANNNPPPSLPDVPSSQDQVLQSKPDYSAMLHQQGAVFDCMEIVLDNVQQSISFLNSFLTDTTSHLQQLSTQLKSQSFKPMEESPVRTFLKVYKK
ncbi:kinetochore-associated protein DSN1 homolog [Leptodactylus fuscus]|uniref:kinetochore-associated protein DSN1 homolog n=1 Tax=Leptodactylus fuscus TaxID=238119 RepID=UPI003F4F36D3